MKVIAGALPGLALLVSIGLASMQCRKTAEDSELQAHEISQGQPINPSLGMSVRGNQLLRDGQLFYARGFNMIGLLSPDACTSPKKAGLEAAAAFSRDELLRARDQWHANTLRFQVSQAALDPEDPLHTNTYVQHVVAGIQLARSLDLVVVVSMQDQIIGCGHVHPLPSDATLRAWATLAPFIKGDRSIMWELFNEPVTMETAAGWKQWRDGGLAPVTDNLGSPSVGHLALVKHARQLGAKGVLIVDGALRGGRLQNLYPDYAIPDGSVVYAIHPYYFHIYNNSPLTADQSNWEERFGTAATHLPVLVTEWNAGLSCKLGQEAAIGPFFAWLHERGIGLLAHAFDYPQTMVQNLEQSMPTKFTGCDVEGSDAGEILQAWFARLGPDASVKPGQ